MIETAWLLLLNGLFWMLRIAPGGSFPRSLTKAEEAAYLARWREGDLEARNYLVEHNLLLVKGSVAGFNGSTVLIKK